MKSKLKRVNQNLLMKLVSNCPKIPPGTSGKHKVSKTTILAGEQIPVVSYRNSYFMNEQRTTITFDQPLVVRELSYDGGVWMSDHPQEIWQMRGPINRAHGNVLVGGLGLGCISHLLVKLSKAKHVTTIEKSQDVYNLVAKHVDAANATIIVGDLFDYIRNTHRKYDFAFFDIWQGTGERDWAEFIVPLRRLCRGTRTKCLASYGTRSARSHTWTKMRGTVTNRCAASRSRKASRSRSSSVSTTRHCSGPSARTTTRCWP